MNSSQIEAVQTASCSRGRKSLHEDEEFFLAAKDDLPAAFYRISTHKKPLLHKRNMPNLIHNNMATNGVSVKRFKRVSFSKNLEAGHSWLPWQALIPHAGTLFPT
ncbi:hypothetical protein BVRB_6g149950 [Beta vulgaris subsp. vulgaris]|nr:hypothetical protein BVRB_6g149950 [Beta vulgaris subsp. vulgaris]